MVVVEYFYGSIEAGSLVSLSPKLLENWALEFLASEDRLLEIEVKQGKRKVNEAKKELTTTSDKIL